MNEYLEYLKNPFIAGAVAGLVIVLFAYIDKRMNDRDFENQYFVRLFIGVFSLVSGLLYFIGSDMKKMKHSGGSIMSGGKSGLEVYTDAPDF